MNITTDGDYQMKLNKKQRIVGAIVFLMMAPVVVPLYLMSYLCGLLSVPEEIFLKLQDFDAFILSKFY